MKKMSKHGFLDILKKTAVERNEDTKTGDEHVTTSETNFSKGGNEKKGGEGWNALKDDFMMRSKLNDWDKVISSDDDDVSSDNNLKRDADDIMDDLSSDEDVAHKRRRT